MQFDQSSRREFITLLGSAAAAGWALAARAQQADLVRRVGVLLPLAENDPETHQRVTLFQQGLAKLGWQVDRNLHVDYRYGAGDVKRMGALAAELVEMQPDVILAGNTPTLDALRQQTRTIPIVFVLVTDPVGQGFVLSFANPGGNITGVANFEASVGSRWLQLMKEVAPAVRRAAVLFNPDTAPYAGSFLRSIEAAVPSFGVDFVAAPVHSPAEIETALTKLGHDAGGGLIVIPEAFTSLHRDLIIALAARYRLPAVYPYRHFVEAGGLMSYGTDTADEYRQAASYVSTILRGAKPADLPVQAQIKYEFVINLKSAKTLGLDIPLSLLMRVDEVIE
jgi:putative tryptophan/tyrosine transport system substrate-binding protein